MDVIPMQAEDFASAAPGQRQQGDRLGSQRSHWLIAGAFLDQYCAYKSELEKAADPAAHLATIRERLDRVRSPFRTAEHFGVEDIIAPRDTRPLLCEFAELAWAKLGAPGGAP